MVVVHSTTGSDAWKVVAMVGVTTVITELSTTLVRTASVRNPRPIQWLADDRGLVMTEAGGACGFSAPWDPAMAGEYCTRPDRRVPVPAAGALKYGVPAKPPQSGNSWQ